MENFLEHIEGQSAEDLTSAVLSYLLGQDMQKAFLKLFLMQLFYDYRLHDPLSEIEVTFHASLGIYGEADLMIESDRYLIIVENKFYADFSQGDQMKRYMDYLQERTHNQKVALVLLTPKERGPYYLTLLQRQLPGIEMTQNNNAGGKRGKYPIRNGLIDLVWLPWEALLRDFRSGNVVVEQLTEFIVNRYLVDTFLTEEELTMINGQEIPVILEKLWGTVNKVRDQLNENYLVKRMGQSRLFYGFFINMSESLGEAWFGLVMSTWKEFGTPLILQIREEWLANSLQDKRLKPKLEEIGFKAHEEFEFIYPLEITSPDCVGDVVLQIENVLAALMNNEVINNN